MKSKLVHSFAQIPETYIPRSVFERNHSYKTTFDEGYLIPFMVDEVLPGDTFKLDSTLLARMSTPVVPFMDNIYLDVFFFAVPNRLVWDNWQRFCGERKNPSDNYTGVIPTIKTTPTEQSIYDYMGLPVNVETKFNVLPLRCYNLIWNEWFRDENLQDLAPLNTTDDTSSEVNNFTLLKRGKRHDYFTSCLPWPQKGPGVELPLGTIAPVRTGEVNSFGSSPRPVSFVKTSNGQPYVVPTSNSDHYGLAITSGSRLSVGKLEGSIYDSASLEGVVPANLFADLSDASSVTLNSLRQAFALQHWYEQLARGGSRYTEILRSTFSVVSPDARLQRPEYLGGTSIPFVVNSVPQTSATGNTTPQGNLSAFSMCTAKAFFEKSFVEHSYIIGLCSIRADITYQQGQNRLWNRSVLSDFYWPAFAHIGEQAVLNKEIYVSGDNTLDNKVFGYQERYAEYRYSPSMITGKLRSQSQTSLDVWHLAQDFDETPVLNAEFIEESPPISRVVAVIDEPHFILDVYNQLKCVRPMPVFGVPGLNRM